MVWPTLGSRTAKEQDRTHLLCMKRSNLGYSLKQFTYLQLTTISQFTLAYL